MASFAWIALAHRPPVTWAAGLVVTALALRPNAPAPEPAPRHVRVVVVAGHLRGDFLPAPDVIDRLIVRPGFWELDRKIFVRLSDVTVTRRP